MSFPNGTGSRQHSLVEREPTPLTGGPADADGCTEVATVEVAPVEVAYDPDARLVRIAALRAAIAGGTYRVPTVAVAEKILTLLTGRGNKLDAAEKVAKSSALNM